MKKKSILAEIEYILGLYNEKNEDNLLNERAIKIILEALKNILENNP